MTYGWVNDNQIFIDFASFKSKCIFEKLFIQSIFVYTLPGNQTHDLDVGKIILH